MIRREEGRKKLRIHIVQKGDTLWKIAKEYGISFEDLKRLNAHLANPDYIVPGMEIILPEKINKETHREPQKETHKESQMHKEMPTQPRPSKESVKKEVQKPMPAPPPIVIQPPAPMPMPEPQMIPIPIPMPMPMPMPQPQQPMWVPQPVELSWNQQLVMPQVQQPAPAPPPVHYVPQMPMVPHCSSCHQPMHHQMWWHMPMQPMQPQVEAYAMPQQPMPCAMPQQAMPQQVEGANFLESSSSPFFNEPQMQPQFDQMPMMPMMPMGQSCGCGAQHGMGQPCGCGAQHGMGQTCGCGAQHGMGQPCGCGSQPVMMPTWQFDPYHCPPPCPSGGPWMSPHYFPGGMTPYRW